MRDKNNDTVSKKRKDLPEDMEEPGRYYLYLLTVSEGLDDSDYCVTNFEDKQEDDADDDYYVTGLYTAMHSYFTLGIDKQQTEEYRYIITKKVFETENDLETGRELFDHVWDIMAFPDDIDMHHSNVYCFTRQDYVREHKLRTEQRAKKFKVEQDKSNMNSVTMGKNNSEPKNKFYDQAEKFMLENITSNSNNTKDNN